MFATTLLALTACLPPPQEPGSSQPLPTQELLRELARHGVRLDPEAGLIELDARVCQVYEPLEYLLVSVPRGKEHESLFSVEGVSAEALNTAMLLLGLQTGINGRRMPKDPPPTPEEYAAGIDGFYTLPAEGDGLYVYACWEKETEAGVESYCYRAEDLVLNVKSERTYQRGAWVYLGSRFIKPHKDAPELFAADAEGNYISLCYFSPANHLVTGADPEADNQYIWYPNLYLLPEMGHPVRLVLSLEPLESPLPSPKAVDGPSK